MTSSQAGKELEWLTGGAVRAGFHEVLFTRATGEKAATQAQQAVRAATSVCACQWVCSRGVIGPCAEP